MGTTHEDEWKILNCQKTSFYKNLTTLKVYNFNIRHVEKSRGLFISLRCIRKFSLFRFQAHYIGIWVFENKRYVYSNIKKLQGEITADLEHFLPETLEWNKRFLKKITRKSWVVYASDPSPPVPHG